ncbi:MAG: hypothetical protein AB8F78_03570 [Saprospiraceae bacterium]
MLQEDLIQRIETAWKVSTNHLLEAAIADEGQAITKLFIAEGDAHFEALAQNNLTESQTLSHKLGTFDWPEGAKRFSILWRNILIELERAYVLHGEGQCSMNEIEVLAKAGREKLQAAARHWLGDFGDRKKDLQSNSEHAANLLYTWDLQHNPWPTYRTQLEQLVDQIGKLHKDSKERLRASKTLVKLTRSLRDRQAQYADDLERIKSTADAALEIIDQADEGSPSNVSLTRLSSLDPSDKLSGSIEDAARISNTIIDQLPERMQLFVNSPSGQMQYRDLNLERQTAQWISAEVLPSLNQEARLAEQSLADLLRTLVDVRNRIQLAKDQEKAETTETETTSAIELTYLKAPIEAMLTRIDHAQNQVEIISRQTSLKIQEHLRLSRVYDPNLDFLEVSFEAGMSQVKRTQDALLNRFGAWIVEQTNSIRNLRSRVEEEEKLSVGEKIVRTIRTRTLDPKNANYTSVLVTRGFIGEAFHAGRDSELERAKNAIEAWRDGFRGSIALTGQRYCGKTHFAELLASRFFEQQTLHVRPDTMLEVNGRKLKLGTDLGTALAFVKKNSVNKQYLILIDDLELWSDTDDGLAVDADDLREAMDELSGRHFFIVAMGNWTFANLDGGLGLAASFQLEINLDTMPLEDFRNTVLIRHAATHVRMLDKNAVQFSDGALREHAEDMFRAAKGNVGDGLRRWAQSVAFEETNVVRTRDHKTYPLPNFIDVSIGLVLSMVKKERYTSEYELRKRFGPAFDKHYRPVVQRLIRLGVLLRHRTGTLSINPVVSNEVGRLLQRDGYLQSSYSQSPLTLI